MAIFSQIERREEIGLEFMLVGVLVALDVGEDGGEIGGNVGRGLQVAGRRVLEVGDSGLPFYVGQDGVDECGCVGFVQWDGGEAVVC